MITVYSYPSNLFDRTSVARSYRTIMNLVHLNAIPGKLVYGIEMALVNSVSRSANIWETSALRFSVLCWKCENYEDILECRICIYFI